MEYIIETEHLGLRIFKMTDAKKLFEYHNEKELKQWIPNESHENIEETKGAIEFFNSCVERNELPYVLAIELKETKELIGDTGLNEVEGVLNEVEIGYAICEKYQRKGYATEVVKAMTAFAKKHFKVSELRGRVMHGNRAPSKVMDKCGYRYIGEEFEAADDPYGKGMLIYKFKL